MAQRTEPEDPGMAVLLVYAASPTECWQQSLHVPCSSTVAHAIEASDLKSTYPALDWRRGGVGIFGIKVSADTQLRAGDRVEIYRALQFDPKESRRRRALHRQNQQRQQRQPRQPRRSVG